MIAFIIILALMIPLVAVILDSQLARALAARLERDGGASGAMLGERVAALESEIERLTAEIERLGDQGEFLHRLLEERPAAERTLPSGDSPD